MNHTARLLQHTLFALFAALPVAGWSYSKTTAPVMTENAFDDAASDAGQPQLSLSSYYVALSGGYVQPNKKSLLHKGFNAQFAYGFREQNYRSALSFGFMQLDVPSEGTQPKPHFQLTSAMFSSYYDINPTGGLSPFIGAGIGYTLRAKTSCEGVAGCSGLSEKGQFAYQFSVGMGFNIDRTRMSLRAQYYDLMKEKGYGMVLFDMVFSYFFAS